MGIEQGEEAYIPKELTQKMLPQSFRYYDPVIKIVQELIPDDKREKFCERYDKELEIYRDKDAYLKLLRRLGPDPNNQWTKHESKALNKMKRNHINVFDSIYSNSVQRSDYLQVDQDLMYDIHLHPEKLAKTNKNIKQRKFAPGESAEDQPSKQLFFKYCKADEVNRKRHIFCLFKATFEAKLIKMKS